MSLPPSVEASWKLADPVLIADTATSRVWRVRRLQGTAIVKHLKPIGVADELEGADYLAWRDGRGAARLLARRGSTLLLEDAGPVPLLDLLERDGDVAATAVLLHVIAELHAPSDTPWPELQTLEERFASLFAQADARADALLAEGASVARQLLDRQRDVRPLHGDLHHENVHHSGRGWLAIDPKGLIGDAAYEVANVFYNPLHRDDLRTDPDRIGRIATAYADRFHRESREVMAWGFAHACLSASWHLEDGDDEKARSTLRVASAIRSLL